MRFVSPETVRIQLGDGDWIEVKKELTVGEQIKLENAGYGRWVPGATGRAIDVDYTAMAMAEIEAYVLDWNAKGPDGKDLAFSRAALETLATEDYGRIRDAVKAHAKAVDEEKKVSAGSRLSTAASA